MYLTLVRDSANECDGDPFTLTATAHNLPAGVDASMLRYNWYLNGKALATGTTSNVYKLDSAHIGDYAYAEVYTPDNICVVNNRNKPAVSHRVTFELKENKELSVALTTNVAVEPAVCPNS